MYHESNPFAEKSKQVLRRKNKVTDLVRTGYIHYIDESHKMIKIRKCEKGHIASFM